MTLFCCMSIILVKKTKNLLGSCVGINFDGKLVSYGVNYMFDSYLTSV